MKILIVNFNLSGFAGDSNQINLIANDLMNLGHKVAIATSDAAAWFVDKEKSRQYSTIRKKLSDAKGKMVEINGIPVYAVHCLSSRLGMYCPTATKFAKEIIRDYDVAYILNWYYHLAGVFSKVAYEYRVPFVVAAYGSLQEKPRNAKKNRKWVINKLYTKNMLSHATGFHSVGDQETAEYIKLGADPNKIYRIDHGINLDDFKIKKRTGILEKIGIDIKHHQYLLDIGRIDPKKGLEIAIHAFAKLIKTHNNLILVIVGTGSDNYVRKVKQLTHELNVADLIKFTGFVTEAEKLELLESAKLLVATSHSDVHTTTAIEAMAMGIPVVITKASDFPEIDEYKAGITVDTDVDSVYNALARLLDNNSNLSEFSHNATKLIKERFLLKNLVKQYERMFTDVIKKFQQENVNIIKK